jgi:hypothetical protein
MPDKIKHDRRRFFKYSHRTIRGGIGHNLLQEAPKAFAEAIIDVAGAVG